MERLYPDIEESKRQGQFFSELLDLDFDCLNSYSRTIKDCLDLLSEAFFEDYNLDFQNLMNPNILYDDCFIENDEDDEEAEIKEQNVKDCIAFLKSYDLKAFASRDNQSVVLELDDYGLDLELSKDEILERARQYREDNL